MKRQMLVAALVLVVASAGLVAQDPPKPQKIDVTGVWESTVEAPQGTMTSTATYKQEGEKLTGTHVGQMGELPLAGTVKGNEIAYTITIDAQGQQFTLTYTGKIDGDAIAGSVDFGGMGSTTWSAKRKK
ncbi:MAG: hypothetical protein IMZ44_14430 [Planctomycetes bacterium]|nr:hypothetical protein [Planctomycetota bacterium]